MTDIRFEDNPFPMIDGEISNSVVKLKEEEQTIEGCISEACNNVICPSPSMCTDVFRTAICM